MFDRRLWILVLSTLLALRPGGAPAAERTARQVLIVYSHEREMAMYTHFDRALRTRLQMAVDSTRERRPDIAVSASSVSTNA